MVGLTNRDSPRTCPVAARSELGSSSVYPLELPADFDGSVATDVNDAGLTVGYLARRNNSTTCEFSYVVGAMWHKDGMAVVLPPLPGHDLAQATAVNAVGLVVGASFGPLGTVGVMWIDGVPHELESLGGREARAVDVNDRGQVVGYSKVPGDPEYLRAVLWEDGAAANLGTLPGGSASRAFGINDAGTIVGRSTVSGGATRPVVWSGGEIVELQTLGLGPVARARAINSRGQIVGGDSGRTLLWDR